MAEPMTTASVKALIYLRVSTAKQATKNGEAEGYSIPAQREACLRRARELGAEVVDEFIDAGASARSADRAYLQRMLERVKQGDITYVIVHKLDRLARSRIDDAQISLAFQMAGTTLVSTSEQIDDSPSGSLVHGIMATIAEHYSKNLSYEAKKGMAEKVRRGGTVGVAPLGYLNHAAHVNGVEIRTVIQDEDRAPHVVWAYQQYATGEHSVSTLRDALEARGFKSRPTRKLVGKPLNSSQIHRMLSNPYYKGQILFNGMLYDGSHEPLVDEVLWQKVQDVLSSRRIAGDRSWRHDHYLKSALRCGRCGSRIGYATSKGHGGAYDYFFCNGRHGKQKTCDLPYINVVDLEEAIDRQWTSVRFTPEQVHAFSERARENLRRSADSGATLIADQRRRLADLERQRQKLVDAYMADALPVDVLKLRQEAVAIEIADAKHLIAAAQTTNDAVNARLEQVIALLGSAEHLYRSVDDAARRLLNSAVFECFRVDQVEENGVPTVAVASAPLTPVVGAVLGGGDEETPAELSLCGGLGVKGSNVTHLAGVPGLEPRITEPESVVLPITPYPNAHPALILPRGVASITIREARPDAKTSFGRASRRGWEQPQAVLTRSARRPVAGACARGPAARSTRTGAARCGGRSPRRGPA